MKRIIEHPGASPGIAIGRVHFTAPTLAEIPQYWIPVEHVPKEIARFTKALDQAHQQLTRIRNRLCRFEKHEQSEIIEIHMMLVKDQLLSEETINTMTQQAINAEWALAKTLDHFIGTFGGVHEAYFRQRREDIEQVGRRVMWSLAGKSHNITDNIPYPATILFALDLSPAEVAALPRRTIKGIVTARGGTTSHTAIIARSLELPAMLGAEAAFAHIKEGDRVILDAVHGKIILHPRTAELNTYRRQRTQRIRAQRTLLEERAAPAITQDGRVFQLGANIELLDEIPAALDHGAEVIGMFRTEYLFMNRTDIPSEEEQLEHYKQTLERMKPHEVTIRTLDVGGDKIVGFTHDAVRRNPALGLRAIRFCLSERAFFITQLRALYRASVYGPLRILLPLVSGLAELRQAKEMIAQVQHELTKEGYPFDPKVPLGIMIEVPSAVMCAEQLAAEVEFFSIGTNDLIQYTLAVDRTDDQVAYLYHPLHPAILRMIHRTVSTAKRSRITVTCCGEMAGDPLTILPLIGLEIDGLSMNSVSIPRVKQLIRHINFHDAKNLVASALTAETPEDVEAMVKQTLTT